MESEKKLRIVSLLGLKSARYGNVKFHLRDFDDFVFDRNMDYQPTPQELDLFIDFFDEGFLESEFSESALIYICGYVSYKMSHKLNCQQCTDMFIADTVVDNDYFECINRGGLKVPSKMCFELGQLCLLTMQHLISEKYEMYFIKSANQRNFLIYLLKESLCLSFNFHFDDSCNLCNEKLSDVRISSLRYFANILLNNYSKCINNKNTVVEDNSRKLSTLKK